MVTYAEENPFPYILINESATDGSAVPNPPTDYRHLFVGEDGLFHLRDSAGTVTTPGGSGGMATDTLWDAAGDVAVGTGANTGAKLTLGAVGGHLSRINGAVAWDSGTSNPGSAVAGDRYWRSDLGQIIYYDGTRWLTANTYSLNGSIAGATATGVGESYVAPDGGADWWLVDFGWTYSISPHNGSDFWDLVLHKYEAGGATDTSVTTLVSDKSSTIWTNAAPTAVGALLGTTIDLVYISTVKHGSAGNLSAAWKLRYRKVVT